MSEEEAQLAETCNMVLDFIPTFAPGYWSGISHQTEPNVLEKATLISVVLMVLAHGRDMKVVTSIQEIDERLIVLFAPFPDDQMIEITGDVLEQAIRREQP